MSVVGWRVLTLSGVLPHRIIFYLNLWERSHMESQLCAWEHNVIANLREGGIDVMNWIELTENGRNWEP